ncbi:MAG: serine/threonine-protein kinase [Acidobacteriota bacterium]
MLLDRFELLEEVGRGASGVVYRARERSTGRVVAVKLLRDDGRRANSLPLRVRLRREASLLGRVKHPGVVNVLDAASERELPYLVTEFVDGVSLEELLRERGPLPPAEIVCLVVQAARALHAAHQQGVVHRDVKPANLLVASDGRLKITDFGVAGETGVEAWEDVEVDQYLWGTPAYLPPERLRGSPLDGRSDLYSLAVVLYRGLSGKHPFEHRSVRELSHRILHEEPLAVSAIRPGLPLDLVAFLNRALKKNPAHRFGDGESFAQALEAIVVPHQSEHGRPTQRRFGIVDDTFAQTRRVPRPRTVRWASLAGAAIAVAAVVSFSWFAGVWRPATIVNAPALAAVPPSPLVPPLAIEFEPASPVVVATSSVRSALDVRAITPGEIPVPASRTTVTSTAHPKTERMRRDAPRAAAWVTRRLDRKQVAESSRSVATILPVERHTAARDPIPTAATSAPVAMIAASDKVAPIVAAPASLTASPTPNPTPSPTPITSAVPADREESIAPPQPGRAVVEITHPLEEGLIEVRVSGRRVSLVRLREGVPALASFRVPAGEQRVAISLLSATQHVDLHQEWVDRWEAGEFRARRWALVGADPQWRLEQQP